MVFVLTAIMSTIMSTTGRLILTIGMMISWDLYKKVRKAEHYGKASNPPIKDDVFLSAVSTMIPAINPRDACQPYRMEIGIMVPIFAIRFAGLFLGDIPDD